MHIMFVASAGIMGPLLGLAYIHISGKAIIMMMLYVWSRSFPEQVRLRTHVVFFFFFSSFLLAGQVMK
jgi:hypothetical protein